MGANVETAGALGGSAENALPVMAVAANKPDTAVSETKSTFNLVDFILNSLKQPTSDRVEYVFTQKAGRGGQ